MRIFEWRQLLTEINNQQIECNQGGVLTSCTSMKYSFPAAGLKLMLLNVVLLIRQSNKYGSNELVKYFQSRIQIFSSSNILHIINSFNKIKY